MRDAEAPREGRATGSPSGGFELLSITIDGVEQPLNLEELDCGPGHWTLYIAVLSFLAAFTIQAFFVTPEGEALAFRLPW